jgi:hypothetical protein
VIAAGASSSISANIVAFFMVTWGEKIYA